MFEIQVGAKSKFKIVLNREDLSVFKYKNLLSVDVSCP